MENSRNLPPNLKVSGFRQTAKRKQGVFEKTTVHTRLLLQSEYIWITIVYFAINICVKIHLFRREIECLPTVLPSFCYFYRHPVLHRAETPHVWLYTVHLVEMWSYFRKRKIQNDNICLRRESNQHPLAFQRASLTTRLWGQLMTYC